MAGIDDQAVGQAELDAIANPRQLQGDFRRSVGIGVAAGVQLDGRRADPGRSRNLTFVGIDEQGNLAADRAQALNRLVDALLLAGDIQSAFGGQFLTTLRHQANVGGADDLGEGEHFLGHAHFEVHPRLQDFLEDSYVALLDMPAIFTQVHGDAVGAGFLGIQGRLHRIGVARAARLAQGGYVVDVDAEKNAVGFSHEWVPCDS
ncbi:hypothetical protein D9M71_420870 [compost metagenome]